MKNLLFPVMLACVTIRPTQVEELAFVPRRIHDLIDLGIAVEHGGCFGNQGLGCQSFFWGGSGDYHVFFSIRNGESFGEFREEKLSSGKFLEITENYLVATARNSKALSTADELPFVCKKTTLEWTNNVWTGSTVQWSFLWCDRDGKVIRRGESHKQQIRRRSIEVHVPKELTPGKHNYSVRVHRATLTQFQ